MVSTYALLSLNKTNLCRLVILQKCIIRIIIFKDLSILKFNDIHFLQLGQFM